MPGRVSTAILFLSVTSIRTKSFCSRTHTGLITPSIYWSSSPNIFCYTPFAHISTWRTFNNTSATTSGSNSVAGKTFIYPHPEISLAWCHLVSTEDHVQPPPSQKKKKKKKNTRTHIKSTNKTQHIGKQTHRQTNNQSINPNNQKKRRTTKRNLTITSVPCTPLLRHDRCRRWSNLFVKS